MISAVVLPQPRPLAAAPEVVTARVRSRAAAGYFRDIALWLNQPLAPHGIFVQVQADRPGCLRLVVEFEQPPIKDRLLRLICHRIWLLNSELIEGIHVVARPLGQRRSLWQQRVKINTPALKQRRAQAVAQAQAQTQHQSPIPPRLHAAARPRLSVQRLKALRAFVLSGSAVAAFVMGCLLEAMLSGTIPSLPQFQAQPWTRGTASETGQGPERASAAAGTSVARRPSVVDAALEPVGVITHQKATATPSSDVTLLFGGDIALENIAPEVLSAPGGVFADVPEYSQADLSLVNLATPLTAAATNLQEELRQQNRTEAVDVLVNGGVDIVNLTHSRLMDYGAVGLDETLTTLDSRGLYRIGAGRNALEARRPEVLDVKGKRIAFLSYAMGGDNAAHDSSVLKERAGASDRAVAREVETFKAATAFRDRAGFNAQNMPEIVADIQALRDEVDWIVVNFRWVDYLGSQPNFMQTNLARLAIDQGADVVVGYHPTVIQGGEIYRGRPIAYSLGDFVFRPDEPIESQDSAVLKVSLKDDQMRVELVPVRVRDSRPQTLTGDDGRAVLQRIEQASSQFDKPLKSPIVLDLQTPVAPPEASGDPGGSFVSPDATEVLPVPPVIQPQGASSAPALPAGAVPTPTVSEPQPSPELDLDLEFDDNLQDWGPKVSPDQREFQPVPLQRDAQPQSHSGGGVDHSSLAQSRQSNPVDSPETQARLWGEDPDGARAAAPSVPARQDSEPLWTDAVPPTPVAMAVN